MRRRRSTRPAPAEADSTTTASSQSGTISKAGTACQPGWAAASGRLPVTWLGNRPRSMM